MVGKGLDILLRFRTSVAVALLPENAESAREEVFPLASNLLAIIVPPVVVHALDQVDKSAQAEAIVRRRITVGRAAIHPTF